MSGSDSGAAWAFWLYLVPGAAAVFLLNVIDRAYLLRAESPAAAGLYSVSIKLATAVIVAVRGFQLAWPPLAYSVQDDEQAGGERVERSRVARLAHPECAPHATGAHRSRSGPS